MLEWVGQKNGHLLSVKMDKDNVLEHIDDKIKSWEETKAAIAAATTEEEKENLELDERYERCCIGSYSEDEYMTIDECIEDLKAFRRAVLDFTEKTAEEVMAMCSYKKNGTFKRTVRPVVVCLNHGVLYQEAYGWSTTQFRIRPESDTEAVAELDYTVIKW